MRIMYSYEGKEEIFVPAKAEVLIGRRKYGVEPDLELFFDNAVSRPHARIWEENRRYWIEDLGSKHGTLVNGKNIKGKGRVLVTSGMHVQIGNTMVWVAENQEPSPPPRSSELRARVTCLPTVNYSLVHAGVPVLSEVGVLNDAQSPATNLSLELFLGRYAFLSHPIDIFTVPGQGCCNVEGQDIPQLSFDRDQLADLRQVRTAALQASLNGEPVSIDPPTEIRLLPPNAWHWRDHHDALAGFAMPHSRAIDEVVFRARHSLRRLMETESFADALDASDPDRVEKMVQAIYFCLNEQYAIAYEFEPRTYDRDWQIVRFHHEVLHDLKGTCIDLALLLAACLENVHLDPVIIIVRTAPDIQHALVGFWQRESSLIQPLVRAGRRIQQLVQSGELILLDSVGYVRGKDADQSFQECKQIGRDYLDKACAKRGDYRFEYALDVITARRHGLMPMPFEEGVQFDKSAELAIFRARELAGELRSPALMARHLFLGLLSLDNGLLQQVFTRLNEDIGQIAAVTRSSIESVEHPRLVLPKSEGWKSIMGRFHHKVTQEQTLLVTETELVTALLETPTQVNTVLERFELDQEQCFNKLEEVIKGGPIPSVWHSSGFM